MIQNIHPQQNQKWKIYKAILEHLIQDELFDYKHLFSAILYVKNSKKGNVFIIPTNFRLLIVDQRNYNFYDLDQPMLYSDIPQNTFEKLKKLEKKKEEPFVIKQNKKSQQKDQDKEKDKACIIFKEFWKEYIFEMDKEELEKFQQFLQKLPEQKRYPRPYQLQKEILQTNKEVSDFYLHDFIRKQVKIVTQEQFWQQQPSYKIPISYTQETYQKNVDFLLNELMNNCKIYKLSSNDKPDYKEKLDLLNDLAQNNEWLENKYMRNRPPKTSKNGLKEIREKTQEEGFICIYEQQQINRELGKYYIKTFGLKMIDDLICTLYYQIKDPKVEQQGTILEPTFLQQIEQENDGLKIQTSSSKTKSSQKIAPMIKKQYQTNNDWERDRSAILQSLKSFNIDSRFQKIEISQTIREDYNLSFKISSQQRRKLEEMDSQNFLAEVRKNYANVRRLLQYFFQGVQNNLNTEQLKEHEQILKEEINLIRKKITQLKPNLTDRDKFKITMYEDLQKQIEKAINEVINI